MNEHETHWRQALNAYTPAATDADWLAMRAQLPGGKPSPRKPFRWWLVLLLLLLVAAGTQVQWKNTNLPPASGPAPALVSPDPVRPEEPVRPISVLPRLPTAPPRQLVASAIPFDTMAQVIPAAPVVARPSERLRRVDLLPVLRPRPVRYRPLARLEAIGKSLIVVPPPPRVRYLENGLYPPIKTTRLH